MLTNYIKFSFRSLMRQKGYTFLNIAGLAVGMAITLIIATWVYRELQTDKHHQNLNQIYRLETGEYPVTPSMTPNFLFPILPEAIEVCRIDINRGSVLASVDGRQFRITSFLIADSSYFNIFSPGLIHGDPLTALSEPLSIVLSRSEAYKIFRDEHPIGKKIRIDNKNDFVVTGVMEDSPLNSTLKPNAIIPFHSLVLQTNDPGILNDWNNWNYYTFLLLPKNHDIAEINKKLEHEMDMRIPIELGFPGEEVKFGFFLRPFKEIYFSNISRDGFPKGNITFIKIYSSIGIFILIIAVINFINLGTAMGFRRNREIGLKKVLGSSRGSVMRQYLSESVMVSIMGIILALMLFEILLPEFNRLTNSSVEFCLFNPGFLFLVLIFAILVGIIAGFYPAFYISKFEPIAVLRGHATKGRIGSLLRKILIVFQFVISITIILATIVIYSQLDFARKKDPGFEKSDVIYFSASGDILSRYDSFRNDIKQIAGVQHIGISSSIPGFVNMGWGRMVDTVERRINALTIDPEFMDVYGLKIIKGRGFDNDLNSDINNAFILNQTAVRQFNLEDPIGVRFSNGTVVGVVEDFSFLSIHHGISPLVIAYMPSWCHYINIKLQGHDNSRTIEQIGEVWKNYAPDFPFSPNYIDTALGRLYEKEARLSKLFLFFSIFAIFVASLGLSGLALFTTQQRTREVGIRKIFGSSVSKIVLLLAGDFLKWVVLANIIAWPLAWYFMNRWLENFAFRISLSWWMFLAAALIAFTIALSTILAQSLKTAIANPVDSIKYE
jgi:putative ABC transport system permease protein